MIEKYFKKRTLTPSLLILISACYILNDIFLVRIGPIFLYTYRYSLIFGSAYLIYKRNWKLRFPKKGFSNIILLFFLFLLISMFSRLSFQPSKTWFSVSLIAAIVFSQINLNKIRNFTRNEKVIFRVWVFLGLLVILQQIGIVPNQGFGVQRSTKLYFSFYERLDFIEIFLFIAHLAFNQKKYLVLALSTVIILITGSFSGIILLGTLFLRLRLKIKTIIFSGLAISIGFFIINRYQNLLFDELELINREKRVESKFGENFIETNWRLIASFVVVEEFLNNPTLLGHGYNSHVYLVKPYYWNKESETYASAHTFTSVLYDQGFIGLLMVSIIIWKLIKRCYLYWRFKYIIPMYISLAVLLRFLVYHQSLISFMMLLMIILIENENSISQFRISTSTRRSRNFHPSPSRNLEQNQ